MPTPNPVPNSKFKAKTTLSIQVDGEDVMLVWKNAPKLWDDSVVNGACVLGHTHVSIVGQSGRGWFVGKVYLRKL